MAEDGGDGAGGGLAVQDHHRHILLGETGDPGAQGVDPGDEEAGAGDRHLHLEQPGQRPAENGGGETGEEDDREGEVEEQAGFPFMPLDEERGVGDGGQGDDAAGADEADEQPFRPADLGAEQGKADGQRADQRPQHQGDQQHPWPVVGGGHGVEVGREEDEEGGDEEGGELFLEMAELVEDVRGQGGKGEAGHRRRQGAGGFQQQVGEGEGGQGRCHRHQTGQGRVAQPVDPGEDDPGQQVAADGAQQGAAAQAEGEVERHVAHAAAVVEQDHLQGHGAEEDAEDIPPDRFPVEQDLQSA